MHVAVQVEGVHVVMQPLDFGDFGIGDVFAGEPSCERLQAAHHVEQFGQIALAQLPHAGAAVGQQLDQSFRRQHLQGFPQRRARDAQHLAELPFGNAAAIGNVAFDDVIAQPRQDLVVQRHVLTVGHGRRRNRLRGGIMGSKGFHEREHMPLIWDRRSQKCTQFID